MGYGLDIWVHYLVRWILWLSLVKICDYCFLKKKRKKEEEDLWLFLWWDVHLGSCFAILYYLNAKPLDSTEMREGFPLNGYIVSRSSLLTKLIGPFPQRHSMNQARLVISR